MSEVDEGIAAMGLAQLVGSVIRCYNTSVIPPQPLQRAKNLDLKLFLPETRPSISGLLGKTVLLGGKRLRSLLTYLAGQANGLSLQDLDPFARMIERIHAASVAHDDVIDEAQRRRGRPSINALSSNKEAILAGDYLLSDVIVELADYGNLEIMRETAKVIFDITEGEWRQLESIRDRQHSLESIMETIRLKTSSTMQWCCVVPAILAQRPKEVQKLWRDFGHFLGFGFQIIDDLLDFTGTGEKTTHSDLENNLVNSVMHFWLEESPTAKSAYEQGTPLAQLWPSAQEQQTAMGQARELANQYLGQCEELLEKLQAPGLMGIVHLIRHRKH